ncbi:MAG: hypothetical protein ACT4OS_00225 [Acidimicrobiales bacterium]
MSTRIRVVGYLLLVLSGVALTGAGPRSGIGQAGTPGTERNAIGSDSGRTDLQITSATDAVGGKAAEITVTAVDRRGRRAESYTGLVRFSTTDTGAGLPAEYRFIPADAGQKQFSVTFNSPGTHSLRVADAANPAAADELRGIRVRAATRSLDLVNVPASAEAGRSFTFTVRAIDADGGRGGDYRGTVRFTSSDTRAVLPGDYTFTPGDDGARRFTATLNSTGNQSLRVADATNNFSDEVTGIAVNTGSSATAERLELIGVADPARAGDRDDFTVRAVRPGGTTDTGYRGRVRFESSDSRFTVIPSEYEFKGSDNGEHRFQVAFDTVGEQRLRAFDRDRSGISGEVTGITVTDRNSTPTSSTTTTTVPGATTTSSTSSTTTSSTSSTTTSSTTTTTSSTTTTQPGATTTTQPGATTTTVAPGAIRIEEATVSNPTPRRGQTVSITGGKPPFAFRVPQDLVVELVGTTSTLPLGTTPVLADGSYIKGDIVISSTLTPGDYDIVVSGFDPANGRIESIGPITVLADVAVGTPPGGDQLPRTGWSPSLLALAGALGLGGTALLRSANRSPAAWGTAFGPGSPSGRTHRSPAGGARGNDVKAKWPPRRRSASPAKSLGKSVRSWFTLTNRPW